jgi:hypothetical protein
MATIRRIQSLEQINIFSIHTEPVTLARQIVAITDHGK